MHRRRGMLAAAVLSAAAGAACTALLGIDQDYVPLASEAGSDGGDDSPAEGGDAQSSDERDASDAEAAIDAPPDASDAAAPIDAGGVVEVTAGKFHTCARFAGGVAKCWGRNDDYGELGDGTNVSRATPVPAMPTGIVDLFAGAHDTCAALGDGGACAGRGGQGMLWNGSGNADSPTPIATAGLPSLPVAFASADRFACALVVGGDVWCVGDGSMGQLGNGNYATSLTPVKTQLGGVATAIAAFASHACALISDGTVECWGDDSYGQLGNGAATPDAGSAAPATVQITGASAIGVGTAHSCALVGSGTTANVWCWGANDHGQLGDGTTNQSAVPVQVLSSTGAGMIAVGGGHACEADLQHGGIKCWGKAGSGQLGDGTDAPASYESTPVDVAIGQGYPVSLAAGGFHTCAIMASPVAQCWGANDFGQVGDGTVGPQRNGPVTVQW